MDSRLRGNDKQQISVLIRVNPVEMLCYLKKQSQFATLTAKGVEQALPNAHIKGKTENIREIV